MQEKLLYFYNIIVLFTEESLAHKVCLLIVQLHIDTNKPSEALKLITYIESQFVSTENATNILTGSADQGGPIHAETEKTEKVQFDWIISELVLMNNVFISVIF